MMSVTKFLGLLCIGLAATMILSQPQAVAQATADPQAAVNQKLNDMAVLLSQQLRKATTRDLILTETRVSPNREQILDLDTTVAKASVQDPTRDPAWEDIRKAMKDVDLLIKGPSRSEEDATKFELYLPVKEHRLKWEGGTDLLVASVPLGWKENKTPVPAYSAKDGSVVMLDPIVPPQTPTIVVGVSEHKSLEPSPPLPDVAGPIDPDYDPCSVPVGDTNSWLAVPWIYLTDDQEGWLMGDPEVYVYVVQKDGKGNVLQSKKYLRKVNDEDHWYYLGDAPDGLLSFFYDTTYDRMTYFHFWEEDGDVTLPFSFSFYGINVNLIIHNDDDDMGAVWVDREAVPWDGMVTFKTGYLRFKVAKRH